MLDIDQFNTLLATLGLSEKTLPVIQMLPIGRRSQETLPFPQRSSYETPDFPVDPYSDWTRREQEINHPPSLLMPSEPVRPELPITPPGFFPPPQFPPINLNPPVGINPPPQFPPLDMTLQPSSNSTTPSSSQPFQPWRPGARGWNAAQTPGKWKAWMGTSTPLARSAGSWKAWQR